MKYDKTEEKKKEFVWSQCSIIHPQNDFIFTIKNKS